MKRRAFLSALGIFGVPAAIAAVPAKPVVPFARAAAQCQCGWWMSVVTRSSEKSHPRDADVWSCCRCERSWRIANQPLPATEVAYDGGMRPR